MEEGQTIMDIITMTIIVIRKCKTISPNMQLLVYVDFAMKKNIE